MNNKKTYYKGHWRREVAVPSDPATWLKEVEDIFETTNVGTIKEAADLLEALSEKIVQAMFLIEGFENIENLVEELSKLLEGKEIPGIEIDRDQIQSLQLFISTRGAEGTLIEDFLPFKLGRPSSPEEVSGELVIIDNPLLGDFSEEVSDALIDEILLEE